MKERGIIFSTPMVRALLAGTKTQTRRIVKPQWKCCAECFKAGVPHNGEEAIFGGGPYLRVTYCEHNDIGGGRMRCPYGIVGDRLWVRETWALLCTADTKHFKAGQPLEGEAEFLHRDRVPMEVVYRADGEKNFAPRWRSPIHMPRWASRLTLEITDVRVERVQSISEADAAAEGFESDDFDKKDVWWQGYDGRLKAHGGNLVHAQVPGVKPPDWLMEPKKMLVNFALQTARQKLHTLWDKLNGEGSWASNPWVWVISFRKLEGGAA